MSNLLHIGTTIDGKPFTIPVDLGDRKIAVLAQSKKGKTYGLGCILEELAEAQRPFIANDPGNNLYGLRVLPDGSPSGLKVVIIGGTHADIPFEKEAGERLAEALLSTPICAVIDVAFESLGSVRRFWTDFAGRLMRSKPEIPRVIVLEESQVLIPQSAHGPQTQICKSAVAKIATIGGNFGYGVIAASQRAATIDKDVLSQCEALIVMGMTHSADRKTVRDWMEAKDIDERTEAAFNELGSLKPGEAWYWAPNDDRFEKFTFRKRRTLHPREMQKLGLKASDVQMGDLETFVERVKRDLAKTSVAVCPSPANPKTREAVGRMAAIAAKNSPPAAPAETVPLDQFQKVQAELIHLKEDLRKERGMREGAEERLQIARNLLKPQYDGLKRLFDEIGEAAHSAPAAGMAEIPEVWEAWLAKAGGKGCKRVLEALLKGGRMTMQQLAARSGIQYGNRSWRDYKSFLVSNHLVQIEGEFIEAVKL